MKRLNSLFVLLFISFAFSTFAQNYDMTDNTTINDCGGTFFDSGGNSNYGNNEDLTFTICPDTPGSFATVDFTSFEIEDSYDFLTIYDGDNTGASTLGTYTGTSGPGFVSATSGNATGCLTFVFTSDGSFTDPGWVGQIGCTQPCQDVIANANFSPAPDGDGIIRICQGETITMNGVGVYPENNSGYSQSDATSTFEWSTQDGANPTGQSVSHTYNNSGAYFVQLEITDVEGCSNSNDIDQVVYVSTTPVFTGTSGTPDPICLGEQADFTGVVTPVQYEQQCTQPNFPPISLPDGSGVSYETSVNLDCYGSGQELTDIADLLSICLNMEHSYIGDLNIEIECPSGQTVTLLDYANNSLGGAHLGNPVDDDSQPNSQGTGAQYCWDPTATNGTWNDNDPGLGSTLPSGTYESDEDLSALEGCAMNGDWTLIITDNLASDNGFIFDWSLNFDSGILPPPTTFTPTIVSDGWQVDPTIVSGTNPITVEPTSTGSACYTYEVTDNFGCSYDTTVCITVNPSPVIDPIADITDCLPVTLPNITGADLSGNQAYYTGANGTGTQYNPGDIISSTTTLYIYDEQSVAPFCFDEEVFTITITNPTLTLTCPGALTATCDISEQPAYGSLADFETAGGSASTTAGANILPATFTLVSEVTDGNNCPEVVTRTYQIEDDCGNVETCTQTITIDDNIDPTGTAPADQSYACLADVPAGSAADITDEADNCATPAVVYNGETTSGTCPMTITRTWDITDDCNNTITVTQLITVDDNIDPTATAPADASYDCIGDVPAASAADITDAADNCTASPTVVYTGETTSGTCPMTITRTWDITDDCNNTITVTQLITVDDNIDPTATAPAPVTVQCAADVPPVDVTDVTGVSDNCSVPTVTHVDDVTDGLSCPETITRTYEITDACGNSITVTQEITIDDTQDPTASNPDPISATGSAPAPDVTVVDDEADNCTTNPTVLFVDDVTDGGTCPEIITRTYSVTDDCGNQILVEQTITIGDAITPTASNPDPITVQCIGDVPAPDPTVVDDETDNGAQPVVTWEDDTSDGQTCPETITRRYRVTDDCGNFIFVEQTITVNDDTDPTGSAPADVSVQCPSDVPAINVNDVVAADNCTANPTITHVADATDGLSCPETITRTYRIEDACGNFIEVDQIITVNDDINPTGSAPADVTVQCIGDVPTEDISTVTGVSDNCTVNPTVSFVGDVTDGLSCPETITRTYRIEDDCGNFIEVDQMITVNDDIDPIGTAPSPVSVECIGDVPAEDITSVTGVSDNCTANPTVTFISDVSDGLSCPETITRTYEIADDCGNSITVTQAITIEDVTAPAITGTLAVITDEGCSAADATDPVNTVADLEAMGVTISDNCTTDANLTVTSTESNSGACPIVITRVYTVTDECGNATTVNQTINVNDTQAPTASNPAGTTVECATDVPPTDPAVVIDEADNCTVTPTVTFVSETSDNNICNGEQIIRTYEVADDCGNTTTVTHTITIDSYTPSFTVAGTDPTVCGGTDGFITISGLDPNTDYGFEYNGNPAISITTDGAGEYVVTGLGAGSYTSFTVSDADCPACSTTDGVTITLTDPNPPAVDAGTDQEACEGSSVTLTANNPDGATITWDNGVTDGVAFTPAVGTITYTVTADLAGCINTDQVDVTVVPTIDGLTCPGQLTAVCNISEQPAYADFDAFIADGGSATIDPAGEIDSTSFVLLSEVSDGLSCPETVTRTYQIADTCGVTVTCSQDIVIHDLINPTASNPLPVSVQCAADVPAPDETVVTDEADNCTTPTVTHVGDASDGLSCPETITRTYRVEDACGNFIEVQQLITIDDDINPTGTAPADVTVQCAADVPLADPTLITDAADNCTTPTVTHVGDASDGLSCPETITRTYRIEDACGNFIEVDQIITIDDDINPTGTAPADVTVECASDVPVADPTLITDEADNCLVPTVTHVGDVTDGNTCNGEIITRTYRIEDACGNFIEVAQTITIDSYTPSFTVSGTDPTVCGGTDGFITISGLNPNTDYLLEYNGGASSTITTDASGEYIITGLGAGSYISFTVSDVDCPSCSTTDGSTISLIDPNAPAVDAGPDQTICDGESVTLTAGNPDGANITWNNGVTDGVAFTPSVGTVDYTVTAELSNCISTDVVTVTVNPLPNVNAGNDIDICGGDQVILTGSGADSYTWDNGVVNGEPFSPSATTTYTVTGTTLGCENTDDVVVNIVDNPVVEFIADTTQGCVPLTVNFSNLTQGSVANCTYILSDGTVLNGCDVTHTFTQAGCYDVTLEVENATGCVSTTTIQDYICVESYPIAGFQFEPGELSNLIDEADFTNSTMGGSTYEWSFGDGATSTSVNPTHIYDTESGEEEYEVTLVAFSEYGCADTISAIIPVIEELLFYVPNTFTPDGDNFNESFKPVFTSGFDPQDYVLLIFNRWGEIVFESKNADVGWDGTYGVEGSDIVKDGTYIWKIEFKTKYTDERKVEVGHVNILR